MSLVSRINALARFRARPAGDGGGVRATVVANGGLLLAVAGGSIVTALIVFFLDRSWASADDGAYGYIAERLLRGDVLHRDIEDIHAGYIHFINAAAMSVFGVDLLSMRYPLAIATLLQSALAFLLAREKGALPAFAAAIAAGVFSFILFNNPTPNWYAVSVSYAAVWAAASRRLLPETREIALGFLVGLIFLLRQPTGVFVGAGVLLTVLLAHSRPAGHSRAASGKALVLAVAAVFAAYVFSKAQPAGVLLFGLGPIAILCAAALRIDTGFAKTAAILLRLTLGAAASAVPLLLYHSFHGTFGAFFKDVFVAPFGLISMPFFDDVSYGYLLAFPAMALAQGDISAIGAFAFWGVLLAAPAVLSVVVLTRLLSRSDRAEATPLMIVAVFHAMVSLHYEIPVYLLYSSGLALVGLIAAAPLRLERTASFAAIGLSAAAVLCLAGQSVVRSYKEVAMLAPSPRLVAAFPRASLLVDPASREQVARPLAIIEACTDRSDPIFAAPLNADLYFLSGRKSAYPFFGSSFGLRSEEDVRRAEGVLFSSGAPALVVHRYSDKYNTTNLDALMSAVMDSYVSLGREADYDYYVRRDRLNRPGCAIGGAPSNG